MEKSKKKLNFAIRQIINATWVLKYEIPDDDINRIRKMLGEEPEAIIREHIRDDKFYNKTNIHFYLVDDKERTAQVLIIELMKKGASSQDVPIRTEKHPIRNKKHIFEYNYAAPIDKILEEHGKNLEAGL